MVFYITRKVTWFSESMEPNGNKQCWDFKFLNKGLIFFSDLTEIKSEFTIETKLTYKIFQPSFKGKNGVGGVAFASGVNINAKVH